MPPAIALCRLDALPERSAASHSPRALTTGRFASAATVAPTPVAGGFFDATGEFLQCKGHDARFQVADGYCVAGPCVGSALQPWHGGLLWTEPPPSS